MSVHLMDEIAKQPGVSCVKVKQPFPWGHHYAQIDLEMAGGVAICTGRGLTETEALERARDQMERCLMEPSPWEQP